MQPQPILHFWFTELTPKDHFAKDPALDETIRTRFGSTLAAAARCELFAWRDTPEGRLAEVLVLDEFSRNVYRDTPQVFAQDALPLAQRSFAYMPFMHSESALVHAQAALLFAQLGNADTLRFEQRHQAIIERFDRYPTATPSSAASPRPRSWCF